MKNDEFIKLVCALEPVEILGLAKILGIEIGDSTTGEQLLIDIAEKYDNLTRIRRRTLLKLLKGQIGAPSKKRGNK